MQTEYKTASSKEKTGKEPLKGEKDIKIIKCNTSVQRDPEMEHSAGETGKKTGRENWYGRGTERCISNSLD